MFDVSWGELFALTGVGIALVGRKDLPKAAFLLGNQVGRIVGILQGARVRADRFTAQNELRQLQNELRSGLRELDAVRTELSVAVSTSGMVGRQLGPTVKAADRRQVTAGAGATSPTSQDVANPVVSATTPSSATTSPSIPSVASPASPPAQESASAVRELAPRSHAVAAVAEEEWAKQGIGFQSRAERGFGDATGSAVLANLLQQSLIYDQHDRVVQEQDEALQSRVDQKLEDRNKKSR